MAFSNNIHTFHTIEDVLAEQITAALSNLSQGVVLLKDPEIEGIKTHILGISSTEDSAILQQIQKKAAELTNADLGELRFKATWQDEEKLKKAVQTFITGHIAVEDVNVAGIMATSRLSNNFATWATYALETKSIGASTPRSGPSTPKAAPKLSPTAGTPRPSPAGAPPAPTTPTGTTSAVVPFCTALGSGGVTLTDYSPGTPPQPAAIAAAAPGSPPHPGASKSPASAPAPASTPAPASPSTPEQSKSGCCC